MQPIDIYTATLLSAIVVLVAGVLYLIETLLRKDHGAGRVWSLAFLAGVLTTLSYLVWTVSPDPWVAIAVGNGAIVASAGCLWLGCRTYNGRPQLVTGLSVGVVSIAAVVAVLVYGPDGGDWAGAVVLFAGVGVFAGLGAIESRRGAMGSSLTSLGFTVVMTIESVFYLSRIVAFVIEGEDGRTFTGLLGSESVAILTICLTIVAVVTASILRAGQTSLRGENDTAVLELAADGVLRASSYHLVMRSLISRAQRNSELIGVVALRIEDLAQIGVAFGTAEQEELTSEWREGVRRYAPNFSLVGEGGPTAILVGFQPSSVGDARRVASRIHRRLLDDFAEMRSAVIPVMGVGVAMSDVVGYDVDAMFAAANAAAVQSASSSDASVIIAGSR